MSAGRGVWVKIRASEAERAAWHAKARSAGLTLSDLVWRSVGRARPWTVAHAEVERERTRELARLGNNLNQIARESLEHLRTRCLVGDDYGYGYRYLTTLLAETPLEWLDALETEYVMGDHDVDPDNPDFGWHGREILRITRESIVTKEVTVGSETESGP